MYYEKSNVCGHFGAKFKPCRVVFFSPRHGQCSLYFFCSIQFQKTDLSQFYSYFHLKIPQKNPTPPKKTSKNTLKTSKKHPKPTKIPIFAPNCTIAIYKTPRKSRFPSRFFPNDGPLQRHLPGPAAAHPRHQEPDADPHTRLVKIIN
jgi:hypothetical protein